MIFKIQRALELHELYWICHTSRVSITKDRPQYLSDTHKKYLNTCSIQPRCYLTYKLQLNQRKCSIYCSEKHTLNKNAFRCVPPASVAVPPATHAPPPATSPWYVCPLPCMPSCHTCSLWTEWLTYRCKNITFPQLCLRAVITFKS